MATTYRYTSNKNDWDGTERLILEGTSVNPERYVDLGGEIELTEEEHESLSKRHNLREVDEQSRDQRGGELPDEDKKAGVSGSSEKAGEDDKSSSEGTTLAEGEGKSAGGRSRRG